MDRFASYYFCHLIQKFSLSDQSVKPEAIRKMHFGKIQRQTQLQFARTVKILKIHEMTGKQTTKSL